MGSIRTLLWRKAYMLEFLKGEEVENVFTFALPPESEELSFSHRVSETKTFGGSVFDSYGEDDITISLSGSTVNNDKKMIYHGNKKMPEFMSGEDEIFALQEQISKWHQVDADGKEKKVYLYDLSKASVLQISTGAINRSWWRVVIKSLKIKRDKNNPIAYNYTLEMLGVEDKNVSMPAPLSELKDKLKNITEIADTIRKIAGNIQGVTAIVNETTSKLKRLETKAAGGNFSPLKLTSTLLYDGPMRIINNDNSNAFYNITQDTFTIIKRLGMVTLDPDLYEEKSSKFENMFKCRVTFMTRGGSAIKMQLVTIGEKAHEPPVPIRNGFTFKGWALDTGTLYDFTSPVIMGFTLYAMWTASRAAITFNSNGGSKVTKMTIKTGTAAIKPADPIKTDCEFLGWQLKDGTVYDWNTIVWHDIVLYAKWSQHWTITFNTNGGSKVTAQTIHAGEMPVCPAAPTKEGAIFVRWCEDALLTIEHDWSVPVYGNITLYADFTQNLNTVTFDTAGGSSIPPQTIQLGNKATIPIPPAREGYTFIDWTTEVGGHFDFNATVTHSVTLYATWAIMHYTVTFNSDNGSAPIGKDAIYNTLVPPLYPTPSKTGAVFCGWKGEDGNDYDWASPIKGNITLTAAWHNIH